MGRTLHYTISKLNGKPFTKEEHRKLYDLSLRYNSGPMEKVWSCENFFPSPYGSYYPNWGNPKLNSLPVDEAYKLVEDKMDQASGDEIEKIEHLRTEGMIQLFHDPNSHEFRGFTKTQGNELNSLLVLIGLAEITDTLPVQVDVHDEGRLLYCDVLLRDGSALPLLDRKIEHFQWLAARFALSAAQRSGLSKKLKFEGMDETLKYEMQLGNPYDPKSDAAYMQNDIDDIMHIQSVLAKRGIKGGDLKHMDKLPVSKWLPLSVVHRQVDPKDYLNYKMSAATLMDGFKGEGFGLSDDTAEADSYRAIAFIQKMVGGKTDPNVKIQVLGVKEPVAPFPPKKKRAVRMKKPSDHKIGS